MKRRYFILFVALPVGLVLAAVAFYRIEDWRGAQAWSAVERELTTRGEPLDLAALIPPPVPDEQNLAKAPVVERGLTEGYIPASSKQPVAWTDMPYGRGGEQQTVTKENWTTGRSMPLASWQRHFAKSKQCWHPTQPGTPADDVLLALVVFAPLLDELVRETETRGDARAPMDWRQETITSLRFAGGPLYQTMVATLRLRACAELAEGQHGKALHDTLAALRLCEAVGREPLMIAPLVDNVCTTLALQPVWEGLATRRWTTEQLQRIQEVLRRDDYLANYVRGARGNRVIGCRTLESVGKSAENGRAALSGGKGLPVAPASEWLARAFVSMPYGWIDQNKANICQLYQKYIDAVDLQARKISLEKVAAADAELSELNKKPYVVYTLFARLVLPTEAYLMSRAARMQTARDQAEIACALERHYLEHGTYPDALDALVPAYLDRVPADVIDGAPMRYRRTADGRYLLYGIGWNGRDDGGTVAWHRGTSSDNPSRPDDKDGDWVWQYTPINPPMGMP